MDLIARTLPRLLLCLACCTYACTAAIGADDNARSNDAPSATVNVNKSARKHSEHGLPQSAVELARPLGLPITNSMVATWIAAAGIILFVGIATRKMSIVPKGAQNFC